jgi:hypothetical protein
MSGYVDEDTENAQVGPWPTDLADLVTRCVYREGWDLILRNEVRDPADTHGVESRGLTLTIITNTINSYPPHQPMRVRHMFAVPPATYNRESWRWWLFERFLSVERHECMEFFTIDGKKPYAPNHGPGWDPYLITVIATDEDRRTSFRGVLNPRDGDLMLTGDEAKLVRELIAHGRTVPGSWSDAERAVMARLFSVPDDLDRIIDRINGEPPTVRGGVQYGIRPHRPLTPPEEPTT